MKTNYLKLLGCGMAILAMSCSTEEPEINQNQLDAVYGKANKGATQISGVGYFVADPTVYALDLEGDLEGIWYIYPSTSACSPSGTYRESGTELFVGTYNGVEGTFETSYNFSAKFEGCGEDGMTPTGAEIFGRCQHPIIKGSGTGVFAGVTGRLDFKDDIENANFPYRGHLKL